MDVVKANNKTPLKNQVKKQLLVPLRNKKARATR